jgi:signal transduction protein with GAF and PtsI domain
VVRGALRSVLVEELGRGTKVFDAGPVTGTLRVMEGPDDVLGLMDTGADGVIALVRDAGATFLAPLYHELTGIVCTSGTPRSHIGIVSREFQVPCAMAVAFASGEPADGTDIQLDCSGDEGVVRG